MAKSASTSTFEPVLIKQAIFDAFWKLAPAKLIRNPVMFVTGAVAALVTLVFVRDVDASSRFANRFAPRIMRRIDKFRLHHFVTTAGLAVLVTTGAQAQILKREPGTGQLRCGKVVRVDDNSCPKGKITQIVGGCNRIGPTSAVAGGARQKSCVPR